MRAIFSAASLRHPGWLAMMIMGAAAILAACSPAAKPLTPAEVAALKPANAHEAELYEHSCKACHAVPGTGAPQVHDSVQWDRRWKKGEDVLLSHVVLGFKGMPAGGQCATCTPNDYKAIIRFMADKE
jgi:cytochrome c5